MMRITRSTFAAAGLAVMSIMAAPVAQAETLADTLVAAYRNSNLLDQNRATLRAADEDVATAVSSLRPVLKWAATAGYSDTDRYEASQAALELTAQMTLMSFGRTGLAIDIAKESVLATREALRGVEQNILLGAVQAYTDVKSASESVAINRNSARVIGEELRAAQDRFEVGEVTRTDVALAEARLAAARAALSAAEGQLQVARESYKAATGAYPVRLAALPPSPKLPKTLAEAQNTAQRLHPSIRQAQRQVTVSELQVAAQAAERMPVLTGSLSAGTGESSITGDLDDVSVGLNLNQTIYSGGRLSALHRRALAGRDAARAGLLQTGVEVAQNVANAWANIAVSRAQISAIDEQIRAATVAFRGVKEEATLGARTTLDVLDAEQDLLNAQADRIEAEAALQVAFYSLLSSMGLLTVDHLNLGIPTYDPAAYYNAVRNAPGTSVQGKSLDRVLRAINKP
ncbi:TolC family outer membrane protein [Phaeovulum veldkampii]|nr:TolC family outer membrane protein [Phaeovulum veldkampii]TDQ59245.1 outer membrane protein [Phaeovulum veldkampii DSM 11550]